MKLCFLSNILGFILLNLAATVTLAANKTPSLNDRKVKIVLNYTKLVQQSYIKSLHSAKNLQNEINRFAQSPSLETHEAVKKAWIEARKDYSPTEAYRFYGGPIDDEDGPEGAINAWPLDEAYIDYVLGDPNSGIINDSKTYPHITAELLRDLNEKEGEKNITTGFHAIEFLIWGQDLSAKGPGQRSYKDYLPLHKPNAERRKTYLTIIAQLLVEDLQSLVQDWDLSHSNSYAKIFTSEKMIVDSFSKIVKSIHVFSAEELSQERIFVAYDTQLQEDEHSCFSDTTHLDLYYNFLGLKNVLSLFLSDSNLSQKTISNKIRDSLNYLESKIQSLNGPFDQAILDEIQRPLLLEIVRGLESLGDEILLLEKEFEI